jgi:hypothetical protein
MWGNVQPNLKNVARRHAIPYYDSTKHTFAIAPSPNVDIRMLLGIVGRKALFLSHRQEPARAAFSAVVHHNKSSIIV